MGIPAKPQDRASRWSITMWLTSKTGYTVSTLDTFTQSMPVNWKLEGQQEVGQDSGKHHFQLMLWTGQVRASQVMKIFPNCYVEVARNQYALQNYVHKEETREAEFKTIQNRSPQWHSVVAHFADWIVASTDMTPDEMYPDEIKLKKWDEFINISLIEGMLLDIVGVNPQYRSCICRYWSAYITLAIQRSLKTDRQTDKQEESPPPENIFSYSIPEPEWHLNTEQVVKLESVVPAVRQVRRVITSAI